LSREAQQIRERVKISRIQLARDGLEDDIERPGRQGDYFGQDGVHLDWVIKRPNEGKDPLAQNGQNVVLAESRGDPGKKLVNVFRKRHWARTLMESKSKLRGKILLGGKRASSEREKSEFDNHKDVEGVKNVLSPNENMGTGKGRRFSKARMKSKNGKGEKKAEH